MKFTSQIKRFEESYDTFHILISIEIYLGIQRVKFGLIKPKIYN